MVVSVTDPKLLIKILQVTFTGGPAERNKNIAIHMEAKNATSSTSVQMTGDVNKNKMMVRVQKKNVYPEVYSDSIPIGILNKS